MARAVLTAILTALTLLVVAFANGRSSPTLATLEGNYAYSRGDYVGATIRYLQIDDSVTAEDVRRSFLDYNLANVYVSLGELEPGLAALEVAAARDVPELRFRVAYNLGSVLFQLGRAGEAALAFRDALLESPSTHDAKVNLELALRKIASNAEPNANSEVPSSGSGEATDLVLEFVRRREAAAATLPAANGSGY
jgi:tetratricopeptide (TPR) repeat protein